MPIMIISSIYTRSIVRLTSDESIIIEALSKTNIKNHTVETLEPCTRLLFKAIDGITKLADKLVRVS